MTINQACVPCWTIFQLTNNCNPADISFLISIVGQFPYLLLIASVFLIIAPRNIGQFGLGCIVVSSYIIADETVTGMFPTSPPENSCLLSGQKISPEMAILSSMITFVWNQGFLSHRIFFISCLAFQGFVRYHIRSHSLESIILGMVMGALYSLTLISLGKLLKKFAWFRKICSKIVFTKNQ